MRLPALFLGFSLVASVAATPSIASAEDGKIGIGGDLVLMIPVGRMSDATGVLVGPVAHGGYRIMPPLEPEGGRRPPRKKADRNAALSARALAALEAWIARAPDSAPGAMATAGGPE